MRIRRFSAVAAVLIPLGVAAAPVAAARADATPAASQPASPLLTFVPPRVGPISVTLGPTIIGGRVINPGLNVSTPGVTLPPMMMAVRPLH
jgi:hypothetical protein